MAAPLAAVAEGLAVGAHTRFTPGKRLRVVTHDKQVIHCWFVEYRSKWIVVRMGGGEKRKIQREDLKSCTVEKERVT